MTYPDTAYDRNTTARILDAMIAAARIAEDVIRAGSARRAGLVWQTKGPADYLTEIDTSSEDLIRHELTVALHDDFPGLRILAEESWPDEELPSELAFVVDPLDGTTNFLHGLPAFSVSIAAIREREPVIARLNGAPIHVSDTSEPARALIGTGFPFGRDAETVRYARQFVPVADATAGIRRVGSAAIDLAWIAAGRFDAFWELHLSPWDIAAGILLVREAGGVVTAFDGAPAGIETTPLVAGNPYMHSWLLDVLHDADNGAEK
jgi:myo-inositol-1(or 4)-monophosphatase